MKKDFILIDVEPYMSCISLVQSGRLTEHYVEYKDYTYITGNIYKGKVVKVLTGLQSAFVDFGSQRNGFLSMEETLSHRSVFDTAGVLPRSLDVKEGDYVMVQATKEELGTKGARLSTTITIPGRYVILLPNLDFVGVSSKIDDPVMRERLTSALIKVKPEGMGLIARTACKDARRGDISEDLGRLLGIWKEVASAYEAAEGIQKVYTDGDFIFRNVRDMLTDDIEAIVVNDPATAERLTADLDARNIRYSDRVRVYDGPYDIFDEFNVLGEVDKLLDRKVKLPSGVSLVFDGTEALTAIDVNTAGFCHGENHEDSVFRANLEAAKEIARQIRLRNIGGIIVVDFIDMTDEDHKQQVLETLRRETLYDRNKVRVIGMSALGLVEITRKKVGRELGSVLLDKCPFCHGDARAHSVDYVARKLTAGLKRLFADRRIRTATVRLNPALLERMFDGKYFSEACESIWRDRRIYMIPEPGLYSRSFELKGSEDPTMSLPTTARLLY